MTGHFTFLAHHLLSQQRTHPAVHSDVALMQGRVRKVGRGRGINNIWNIKKHTIHEKTSRHIKIEKHKNATILYTNHTYRKIYR